MKKRNILSIIFSLLFILVLSACNNTTSRPNLNVFENIVFEDKEVTYNGEFHSIYVSNAPDFAEITYP